MTNQAYEHVSAIPIITSFPALMLDSDPGMFDTTTNALAAVPNVPAKLFFDILPFCYIKGFIRSYPGTFLSPREMTSDCFPTASTRAT